MIKTENLSKSFDDLTALDQINLHVKKGTVYGLVGPNGSGKTTLIKTLVGIYKANEGKTFVDDDSIYENNQAKSKLFYVPDTLYFLPNSTVRSMANFYNDTYSTFDFSRFNTIINHINIAINTRIASLSKGMKRQVALALAISSKPEVLILDEPVDGLDPIIRKQIWSLILQDVAEANMTVLISSHNLSELEGICDTIGILHNGQLIVEKILDELKATVHKLQVAFNSQPNLKDLTILKETSVGKIKTLIIKGNKESIVNHLEKYNPLMLEYIPLTLEEIFIYELGGNGYEFENIII